MNAANDRSGGGCAKDEAGRLVQVKDQDGEGATFRSLLSSRDRDHPVGLIIGQLILNSLSIFLLTLH